MTKFSYFSIFTTFLALIISPLYLKSYGVYLMSYWLVFLIACIGLNLILGYTGLKSLGQAAFMGIGAYIVAIGMKYGFSFWVLVPIAIFVCFWLGWLVGFPALRVQMHYLAFATIGFNEVLTLILRNEENFTGGSLGINGINRPSIFGVSLESNLNYYYFVLICAVITLLINRYSLKSPWGRAWMAIRDNAIRAESVGINVQKYTLLSFAIGSAIAGFAGCLIAPLIQYIEPSQFNSQTSILLYLMVVVGGSGYFLGPILGSIIGIVLPEWLRFTEGLYMLFFGLMVVILMYKLPNGLSSIPELFNKKKQ